MIIGTEEVIELVEHTATNEVTLNLMKPDECYKYLGQDEIISYVGPSSKDKVIKEYTKKTKIWTSELSAYNITYFS